MELIQPKEISVKLQDGTEKVFVISKFPAIQGREIVCKYPLSAIPKLGDYAVNEETMLKLMSFVGVPMEARAPLQLTTKALVDNHVPDWEALVRIEKEMLEYNCSFFKGGVVSTFCAMLGKKAGEWITQTLIPSLRASLAKGSQPSKS